jgi:protein-L-isoaspartate(D-aspartate) O-methyltransferase
MAKVPREEFVPIEVQSYAYLDRPIPIGFDKTISQPFMVAVMTDLLELKPDDVVLEIGTGLGYQSAVLAELASRVYSVEIIDELAQRAIRRLKQLGYTNVEVRIGNGYAGWPEHAPFDKVMVTAAPDLIPPPLIKSRSACPAPSSLLWRRRTRTAGSKRRKLCRYCSRSSRDPTNLHSGRPDQDER